MAEEQRFDHSHKQPSGSNSGPKPNMPIDVEQRLTKAVGPVVELLNCQLAEAYGEIVIAP